VSPSEKTQPRTGGATGTERQAASGSSPDAGAASAPRDRTATQAAAPAGPRPAAREQAPGQAPAQAPGQATSQAAGEAAGAPRKVRLTVAHLNPWSVAKLTFLLSVALGIVLVVVVALLWSVVNGMGVFSDLDGVIRDVVGKESTFDLMDYVGLSRVLSVTITLAVLDVILITVISTLAAVLYNLASSLVGGLRLTLSDD
jgi:nitrogen fixation-related uncharacterized protein